MKQITRILLATLVAVSPTMAYPAGKIQNQDVKSEAELTTAGATKASLINDSKIYVTGNGINDRLDTAINNGLIGGGGGSKNYLSNGVVASNGSGSPNPGNGDFEKNATTGWTLAHSAISSNILTSVGSSGVPFSSSAGGTAAAGTLSRAIVSSSTLQKKYSLNYASSAASTAGDMLISDGFYIDDADKAKMMQVKFAYKVNSGAANINIAGTSSNSFSIWIYDVDGAAWIQPAGVYNIIQNSGVGVATATFQTTITGTRYQLALVNNAASAGAFSLYVDDFQIGPQVTSIGPAMSDWVQYTPTFVGFGTVSGTQVFSRRVGDNLEVKGATTCGTTTATTASMTVGYNGVSGNVVVDTSKVQANTLVGRHSTGVASSTVFVGGVLAPNSSLNTVGFSVGSTTLNPVATANGNAVCSNAQSFQFFFSVPIVGWSSNSVQSSDTDTRQVAYFGVTNTNTVPASASNTTWTTTVTDTHGGFSSPATYTVPVSGLYDINANMTVSPAAATGGTMFVNIAVNGSSILSGTPGQAIPAAGQNYTVAAHALKQLKAGDTVTIPINQNTGNTVSIVSGQLSILRLAGPAVVQATESVSFRYTSSSGQSIPTAVETAVVFANKDYDSHSMMNTSTGVATLPISGKYTCSCKVSYASFNPAVSSMYSGLFKNGSVISYTPYVTTASQANTWGPFPFTDSFSANAGDTIECRTFQNTGAGRALIATAQYNTFACSRVGN